ncbi:hypothetical protein AVEN_93198-1 [Araneus ventricosus]|uniref:Uncharacterized protein n=1 Tax=Araneus ventricosus TaxID=182803 RepID=A0A4Y2TLI8_ARAVE|nr:hypothetical protein AVEN_93198-1 [Araneus ventricosus]
MPVIKQRDTNEDCAKTLASTENKLAEDANTSFIEEKSVKDRRPPKQGVKRVNGGIHLNAGPTCLTRLGRNHVLSIEPVLGSCFTSLSEGNLFPSVYFDVRVEHIKFVDFCGKYRIPLLQYLCSPRCSDISSASHSDVTSSDDDSDVPHSRLRRVLLG